MAQIVEYGGRLRHIIDHNPKRRRKNPREDEEEEDDEDEDPEHDQYADDIWPYSQVNIKGMVIPNALLIVELLISLSHPSELVTHPALVRTFKNNKIRVLAEQALDSIRSEHQHMTKLSRLLSVLLGDEDVLAEPEEVTSALPQTMDDSDTDKDIDIMDLDEPAKTNEVTNGEPNGHPSDEPDIDGIQINGTAEDTAPNGQLEPNDTADPAQPMETDQPSESTVLGNNTDSQPPNDTTDATANGTPSRTPTPVAVTRPTTRLQTAANIRPRNADTGFTWPSSLMQPAPSTTIADLGLTPNDAAEIRRMVQAALERSQEFLRCLEKVKMALDRAEKQRKTVWLWCKDSAKLVEEQEREEQ